MGKKYRNLLEKIGAERNMRAALQQASRSKRQTVGFLEFKEYAEINLAKLADEIASGTYRLGQTREFYVYEPKRRLISALPFYDRVAQHALVNIVGPIFDATLLPGTYACRKGKGTHAGVKAVQAELHNIKKQIEDFSREKLGLSLSRWSVSSISRGVNFLGYRIWPTHKLLRRDSVKSARQKVRRYLKNDERQRLQRFVSSWNGHIKWADAHNLRSMLNKEIENADY